MPLKLYIGSMEPAPDLEAPTLAISPIIASLKTLETSILERFAAEPWASDSPLRRGRLVAPGCRDPKETTAFVQQINKILEERGEK